MPGFFAALASVAQFGIDLAEIQKGDIGQIRFGQLLPLIPSTCAWFANVLMLMAPTFFRRVCARKGEVYLALMLCSSFLIVVLPLFSAGKAASGIEIFHYGYFVWGGSNFFMTFFFLGLRLQAAAFPSQGRSQ